MMGDYSKAELEEFENSGFLTTHLMLEALLERSDHERNETSLSKEARAITLVVTKIEEAIEVFNTQVWNKWLSAFQAQEDSRFLEATAGNVNLLLGSTAGRVMITLRWKDPPDPEFSHHFVSLLGADEKPPGDGKCGFQGIGMNGEEASELLLSAARLSPDLHESIKPSQGIHFG